MNKSNNSSLFKTSLLVAMLAGAFSAHAAGLGKLTVYSAIGQPLNAELALTASPEELNSLSAKLASHNAFRDAGIEFMPALTSLRFSVAKSAAGQAVLRLHTDNPLNEPFLHFLVELNWSTGRMVREYTFLLDPPEMVQASKPASVVAPAIPVGMSAPQVTQLPPPVPKAKDLPAPVAVPAARVPAAAPERSAPVAAQPAAHEYRVKSGDTLGKIARETRADNVSLDQMLVALFNSNRDAFDGGNMNRLRAGKILRVPEASDVASVDAGEARKLVIGQAADFNAYRRRLAETVVAAPATEAPPQQQVAGKIKPQVESKAPAAPAQDKLEVSRTETDKAGKQAKVALEEELIARDKALREASERIAQLEKSLDNLKQLVEIKSQGGAQLQQQAKPAPTVAEKKPEPAPVVKPAEPSPAPVVAASSAPAAEKAAEPPAATKPAETPVVQEKAIEQPAVPVAPVAEKLAVEAAPAPVAKKPVAPPPPPEPEPSFAEDNPEIVFGGAGLIALLLGYLGFTAWRKKKQAAAAASSEPLSDSMAAATSETSAGVAASEALLPPSESAEVSILGDFSESGALTTEENVDPVAEADVLMAYGRDAQAEEILLEGLKADPTRAAIHLKLLELYAHRQDAVQFESVATELFALSNGQGSEWEKAAAMAHELGVAHGVFAATAGAAEYPVANESEPVVEQPAAIEHAAGSTVILESSPLVSPEPEAAESGDGLDFDLDLGTTSAPAAAQVAAASVEAPAEEVMSLDFDFDLGTAEPAPPQVETVSEPAARVEDVAQDVAPEGAGNTIDFSLDIGSSPAASEPESMVEPMAEVAAGSGNEIDFDLDLGVAADSEPVAEAVKLADEVPAAGDLDEVKLDFDVQLDGGVPAVEPAVAEDVPVALDLADISLDLDQPEAEAPALDIELPAATNEAEPLAALDLPAVEAPAAESEAGADFDLDLGMEIGEAAIPPVAEVVAEVSPAVKPAVVAVDLPDIDLSLDTPELAVDQSAMDMAGEMDFDLGSNETDAAAVEAEVEPDDPEVATKLELAQAYEEMGDREGARELLNEVLNEGSAAQRAAAQARLDQLAI